MIGHVLQFEDLQRMCRPNPDAPMPKLSTVVRWAEQQGIRYKYDGQGGIWTTLEAVNAALGIGSANDSQAYSPSELFGHER